MSILSSTNSGTKNIKISREILKRNGFIYRGKNNLLLPTYMYGILEISHIILGGYYTTNFPGLDGFEIKSVYDLEMIVRYYKAFQAFDRTEMSKIRIDLGLEKPKVMKIINTYTEIKYVNSNKH